MWIFTKPLEQLSEADLQGLIGQRESRTLEFKGEMYARKDPIATREMLRDITSMANAEGGLLIIGMHESAGEASLLRGIPEASGEAQRVIDVCRRQVADPIPLRTHCVALECGGAALLIQIPRSYRRPHMIITDTGNELWIRQDRSKASMSIAEIRTAVTSTQDLAMRIEEFIKERRRHVADEFSGIALLLTGTPLVIEEDRIDPLSEAFRALLRAPPTFTARGGELSGPSYRVEPTIDGIRARDIRASRQRLEIFRNGHLQFVLYQPDDLVGPPRDEGVLLRGVAIACYIRNFVHCLWKVREVGNIMDPYVLTASLVGCKGAVLQPDGRVSGWHGDELSQLEGSRQELYIGPFVTMADEQPDDAVRRMLDRLWHAFHFEACPFFDGKGTFTLPPP